MAEPLLGPSGVLGDAGGSGTLDLGGATVDLARPLEVRAGGTKTVRNGTLRWTGGDKGGLGYKGGYGVFVAGAGARLVLEGVTVVGTGVRVGGGGHARLARCAVRDAPRTGVLAHGLGGRVEVEGGIVSGSKEYDGICAQHGGHAVVKDVRVEDNQRCGVFVHGQGSRVELEGGSVSGSKRFHGIIAQHGGRAVVKGAQISSCARYGLCRDGDDSHMEVGDGVTIWGCGQGDRHGC